VRGAGRAGICASVQGVMYLSEHMFAA